MAKAASVDVKVEVIGPKALVYFDLFLGIIFARIGRKLVGGWSLGALFLATLVASLRAHALHEMIDLLTLLGGGAALGIVGQIGLQGLIKDRQAGTSAPKLRALEAAEVSPPTALADLPTSGRISPSMVALTAIAAMTIAVFAVGILRTRQDRGWLEHPETHAEAHWSPAALPVHLLLISDARADWVGPLIAGALAWNDAAGAEVLDVLPDDGEIPARGTVVLVDLLPPTEDGPDARPHTTPAIGLDGAIRYASMHLPISVVERARRERIAAHELGHLIGLGGPGPQQAEMHDDDEGSVMYRASAAPNGSTGTWSISEADRQRVRRRYGGGPPGGPNAEASR